MRIKERRYGAWGLERENPVYFKSFLETIISVSPEHSPRSYSLFDTVALSLYPGRCVFPGSKDDLEVRMVQKQDDLVISTLDSLFIALY